MVDEIWAFRKYDYFGFKVAPGDVVVDVGANIGTFSLYAATEGAAARVIALEPHPGNFALLRQNVVENCDSIVTCCEAAVGANAGTARLEVNPRNPGAHHLTGDAGPRTIEVTCKTLDQVVAEHDLDRIDYLKLDCEGAEYDFLVRSSDATINKINRISMEYHRVPGRKPEELGEILTRNGFSVRYYERDRLYAERLT